MGTQFYGQKLNSAKKRANTNTQKSKKHIEK